MSRSELASKLELKGHKIVGSISSKTDYLITNDTTSGTVKNKKAKSLSIPIITEDEEFLTTKFDEKIGKRSQKKGK